VWAVELRRGAIAPCEGTGNGHRAIGSFLTGCDVQSVEAVEHTSVLIGFGDDVRVPLLGSIAGVETIPDSVQPVTPWQGRRVPEAVVIPAGGLIKLTCQSGDELLPELLSASHA